MLPKGLLKEYSRAIVMIVRFLDMLTILCAGWLAFVVRFNDPRLPGSYWVAITIGLLLLPIVFSFFEIYTALRGKNYLHYAFILLQAVCTVALIMISLAFFTKSSEVFSRIWFSIWMGMTFGLLMLSRYGLFLFLRYMRTHGLNERRVIVIGANELGIKLIDN